MQLKIPRNKDLRKALRLSLPVNIKGGIFSDYAMFEDEELFIVASVIDKFHPNLGNKLRTNIKFKKARAIATARDDNIRASLQVGSDLNIPQPEGLSLYPFQRAGVEFISKRTGTLLGDDMGLGKTPQVLCAINLLNPNRVVIVCPASLKINWKREANTWLTLDYPITILSGSPEGELPIGRHMFIINYTIVDRWLDLLMQEDIDFLAVDESHYIKNYRAYTKRDGTKIVSGTTRAKTTFQLIAHSKRKVFMTGTPLVNEAMDLWAFIHTLNPIYWDNFWNYIDLFGNTKRMGGRQIIIGVKNLHTLQRKLRGTVMVRRMKKEVLKDLPPKIRQVIPILSKEEAQFDSEEERVRAEVQNILRGLREGKAVKDIPPITPVDSTKVHFSQLSRIRHQCALHKLPEVVEFVKNTLKKTSKVVVFAHHKDVVMGVAKHFLGEVVTLTGTDSLESRQRAVDSFQTNPKVRVFVGNIQAAGVGLTLTVADTVIFAELDWVPANILQAEDRLWRIGQKNTVFVYHLVVEGTIDDRIAQIMVHKQNLADNALDVDLSYKAILEELAILS